ncbi:hypothetical protein I3271_04440 [Photobacterium leiognathi]|uniref:hypothetical protein n=1 Tax=Photobacterium leiognathi TaxID=553611 RepID=UPI001EDE93F7|nr:hypothetical protein [Photobacterium leiognathi]MCG3883934.1 hypothetical protein [Photobacterium leiognathi]
MAAIGLIFDGIRFDFAILGMAISCVLFITGVLEPTKFKLISEDYNDELVGMSVQSNRLFWPTFP